MGKKPQRHSWAEAKKLCRLNQDDIEMAKRLGFRPDALIRAIPNPKQEWKLPVKQWVRMLYGERFGVILGEKPTVAAPADEYDEEAARRFGEELYWEDYRERNQEEPGAKAVTKSVPLRSRAGSSAANPLVADDDVPF
jgi:hypothetical protein